MGAEAGVEEEEDEDEEEGAGLGVAAVTDFSASAGRPSLGSNDVSSVAILYERTTLAWVVV